MFFFWKLIGFASISRLSLAPVGGSCPHPPVTTLMNTTARNRDLNSFFLFWKISRYLSNFQTSATCNSMVAGVTDEWKLLAGGFRGSDDDHRDRAARRRRSRRYLLRKQDRRGWLHSASKSRRHHRRTQRLRSSISIHLIDPSLIEPVMDWMQCEVALTLSLSILLP